MNSPNNTVTVEELSNTCRSWNERWGSFLGKHKDWWEKRIGKNPQPLYTIPKFVLSSLVASAKAEGNSRATVGLLSEEDEKAERDFRKTCEGFLPDVIGVWRGFPVSYPLLFPVESNLGLDAGQFELLKEFDPHIKIDPKQINADLKANREKLVEVRHQLLGYVGFLNSDVQFTVERDALRELWQQLPPDSLLPTASAMLLAPRVSQETPPTFKRLSPQLNAFYDSFRKCNHKWNLSGFATWDLPLPQGPLTGLPAGLITQLRGPEATVEFTPSHYETASKIDMREELRKRQKREGEIKGLKCELPLTGLSARRRKGGVGHEMSEYEMSFRIWFVTTTVKSRYGDIRGAKFRLDEAFSEQLGISEARVKKVRTANEKVLAGLRKKSLSAE